MKKLLTVILLVAVAACSNSKDATNKKSQYVVEAENRFGTAFKCEPNAAEDFILCTHRPDTTATNPLPRVAYFVYDTSKSEISHEEAEFAGDVKWIGEYELELTLTPGIVRDDGSGKPVYNFDVRTGQRRKVDKTARIPN